VLRGSAAGVRTQCGADGTGLDACIELGCCYDEYVPANFTGVVPACYTAPAPGTGYDSNASLVCDVTAKYKDCGYSGIPKATCLSRGCCWDSGPTVVGWQCYSTRVVVAASISFAVAPAPPEQCFSVTNVFGFPRGRTCAHNGTCPRRRLPPTLPRRCLLRRPPAHHTPLPRPVPLPQRVLHRWDLSVRQPTQQPRYRLPIRLRASLPLHPPRTPSARAAARHPR
jgi:hypothetical protein